MNVDRGTLVYLQQQHYSEFPMQPHHGNFTPVLPPLFGNTPLLFYLWPMVKQVTYVAAQYNHVVCHSVQYNQACVAVVLGAPTVGVILTIMCKSIAKQENKTPTSYWK